MASAANGMPYEPAAAPQGGERRTILELDGRDEQSPANRDPDRDPGEEHGDAQSGDRERRDREGAEQRPHAFQRQPPAGIA